jgi:hypothetical protein
MDLNRIISEELEKMVTEAKKKETSIAGKLDALREKLVKALAKANKDCDVSKERIEKRVEIDMVADIIDVPKNELILYFLNTVKASNGRQLIEYRVGNVHFYTC